LIKLLAKCHELSLKEMKQTTFMLSVCLEALGARKPSPSFSLIPVLNRDAAEN